MGKPEHFLDIHKSAECLFAEQSIQAGIADLAKKLDARLQNQNPVFISIMNGALFFTADLLKQFSFPLQFDYLHLSRYQGATQGADITWYAKPQLALENRCVVLLDDIFDQGYSLQAARQRCQESGAQEIITAVLLKKKLENAQQVGEPDYFVFECPDRYVFGYGMDYQHYFRNLPAIYTLKEQEAEHG